VKFLALADAVEALLAKPIRLYDMVKLAVPPPYNVPNHVTITDQSSLGRRYVFEVRVKALRLSLPIAKDAGVAEHGHAF
jgi:hypothetical protein